ncbi:phosphotransferase [Hazenella coriacea]|uniref:Aminoglycoside 2''-phosphotransferase n=1 Tax=Hazenella coriacea TaxID=1179467 RepID=A0A4R3L523_9BACL|nr:phosphotransferase [Hazenella coriacea]TCS93880.1 aminoglycoside 2''-phosphotransferase [Hazenella coriacea]
MQKYIQSIETTFSLSITNIKEIQEGWDFVVIEVNSEWMFRFPRRASGLQQLKKEIAILPLVDSVLPVQVPRYEYIHLDSNQPYGGYKKINGTPLSNVSLNTFNPNRFALQIGRCLTALHTINYSDSRSNLLEIWPPEKWQSQYQKDYERLEHEGFPLISPHVRRQLQVKWKEFLSQPQFFSFQPCFIHKDLTENHLLLNGEQLSGIIDWGDACVGDPALDFAGLESFFGNSFTSQLIKHYRGMADPYFSERVRFYNEWIHVHHLFHAIEEKRQDLLHTSILKLERIAMS